MELTKALKRSRGWGSDFRRLQKSLFVSLTKKSFTAKDCNRQ